MSVISVLFFIVVYVLIIYLSVMSARKFVNWYRLKLDTTSDLTEVNFYRDMRGRLGEYQRMRNWCQANIGKSAESADTVDHIHVFYIGKKMSAMQFVFYNRNDFDLFNQHWDIVNHEDSSNSAQG